MDSHLISVAIDFGTTYSGYAYSTLDDFRKDPTKIYCNDNWAIGGRGFSLKTPTCVLLKPNLEFHSFGHEAEDEYTSLAEEDEHTEWYCFKNFKMQLYGDKNISLDMQIEDLMGKKLSALKVFSQSIKYLKDHFVAKLDNQGTLIKQGEVRWVLTVPAIWNDSAKSFMRQAAVQAGIEDERLLIALEPEAASLICQFIKFDRDEDFHQPGKRYMVLDLGGGTADITVHEKCPNGQLRELSKASGGAWGGTAVDEEYIKFLIRIVGGPTIQRFRKEACYDYLDMLREFEVTKRTIKGSGRSRVNFRIPTKLKEICQEENEEDLALILQSDNCPFKDKANVRRDKLSITSDIVQGLFGNVIRNVEELVQVMLSKEDCSDLSAIIMVGGFSECVFVQEAIKEKFETPTRKVIVPAECGLCVLKGAVIFGHSPDKIGWRIMRYSYGIEVEKEFIEGEHRKDYKFTVDNVEHCSHLFDEFMKAGSQVSLDHKISKRFLFYSSEYETDAFSVFVSNRESTMYTTDAGCRLLCRKKYCEIVRKKPKHQYHNFVAVFIFGDTELTIDLTFESGEKYRMSCNTGLSY